MAVSQATHGIGRIHRYTLGATSAMAGLAVVAGILHIEAVRTHAGIFRMLFLAVVAAQLLWGALVLARPGRVVYGLGILGNAVLIAGWVASRTVGLPHGHGVVHPEPVGTIDLLASTGELLIVVGCVALLAAGAGSRRALAGLRAGSGR